MGIDDFRSIEFGVSTIINNEEFHFLIPIDDSVRETLFSMLDQFYQDYFAIGYDIEDFQASQKYSATEKLRMNLNDPAVSELTDLYNERQIPISQISLSELAVNVIFYFGVFRHNNGTKSIAVKRPTQFKSLLKKKLIRLVDDTLQSVPDDTFKLDNDFDFVIHGNEIDILHPSGFVFISNMDEEILRSAENSTRELNNRILFINFNSIASFVAQSKTAAKLIASIKSRDDLERTTQRKLLRKCRSLGVLIREENGLIIPEENSVIDFLQILDRREYDFDLTDNNPEIYIAASRKRKN